MTEQRAALNVDSSSAGMLYYNPRASTYYYLSVIRKPSGWN
jgi:hypothetical protein